tara:strand:+ start:756 stop:1520 length:765 start_codon:yes stop_codon:yes gene_type:complete
MFPIKRILTSGRDEFLDEFSLAFDGSNDYIDCQTNFESNLFNSAFSIALWLKVVDGTPSAIEYIFGTKSGEDNIWARVETDGDIQFYYKEGSTEANVTASTYFSSAPANSYDWVHFVFTLSDSAQTIYANGVEIASGTTSLDTSGFAQDTNRNLFIGARNNAGSADGNMEGKISDFAIYDIALTEGQVKTIYNKRQPYNHRRSILDNNLLAWYRMGDGIENGVQISKVYDMSSNNNVAAPQNMAANDYENPGVR